MSPAQRLARAGHAVNAALRFVANRLSGGYLARLDARTEEMLQLAQENRALMLRLHDRLQDETLAAHLIDRLNAGEDSPAPRRAAGR